MQGINRYFSEAPIGCFFKTDILSTELFIKISETTAFGIKNKKMHSFHSAIIVSALYISEIFEGSDLKEGIISEESYLPTPNMISQINEMSFLIGICQATFIQLIPKCSSEIKSNLDDVTSLLRNYIIKTFYPDPQENIFKFESPL